MAECDSTTVQVDLIFLNTKNLHVSEGNDTESLVDLESIDSRELHLCVLQSLGHGERWGSGELGGVLLSVTPAEDLSNGLEAVLLDSLLRGKYESSSAIGEGRGVGSGDGSVSRLEGRL